MLILLPEALRKIDFSHVFPFNDDDIMVCYDEHISFRLSDIKDFSGVPFSIRALMDSDKSLFGKQSFDERYDTFAKDLKTRISRRYVMQKDETLFFDSLECDRLKENFKVAPIICRRVVPYINMEPVVMSQVDGTIQAKVVDALREIGAVSVDDPEKEYLSVRKVDRSKMPTYPIHYPELKTVKTKDEFGKWYKKKSKELHPDAGGDTDKFQEFNEDVSKIKKGSWYARLK